MCRSFRWVVKFPPTGSKISSNLCFKKTYKLTVLWNLDILIFQVILTYLSPPLSRFTIFIFIIFLAQFFVISSEKKNSFNDEIFLILNAAGRNSRTQLTLKCSANKKILKLNVVSAISPCHYVAMVVREMEFRVFNFLFNQRPLFCSRILAMYQTCHVTYWHEISSMNLRLVCNDLT